METGCVGVGIMLQALCFCGHLENPRVSRGQGSTPGGKASTRGFTSCALEAPVSWSLGHACAESQVPSHPACVTRASSRLLLPSRQTHP